MRIAIVNLTNGGLSGGYRKYLEALVPLLRDDPRVDNLEVFLPVRAAGFLPLEGCKVRTWPAAKSISVHSWIRARLREEAPDVVFIPSARSLDCGGIPVVGMVRNMEPLLIPFGGNPAREGVRNLARAYVARRACQRLDRVIAVSHHVKEFLIRKWDVDAEKIGVVPHGVQTPLPESESKMPEMIDERAGRIIFTAGSIRPARGLEDVIKAMAHLVRDPDLSFTLVIGGRPDPGMEFYKKRLMRLAIESGVASQIIWAGQLSPAEMSWCFYHCELFVMTSRAEACPNTVLEAMSHGCLCISTNHPPMPEFFGSAAFYYHAGEAASLLKCVRSAVAATESEKKLKRKEARERANLFDWGATANDTIAQLELVLEKGATT